MRQTIVTAPMIAMMTPATAEMTVLIAEPIEEIIAPLSQWKVCM